MNIFEIFKFSFGALRDRRLRSALTILMVIIGATLIVSLNGMSAGMNNFITQQFSDLAPNILMVTPAPVIQTDQGGGIPVKLNAYTVKNFENIPGVKEVIPTILKIATLHVGGVSMTVTVMGSDQTKDNYITPTLEYAEGTYVQPHDSVGAVVGHDIVYPPGRTTPLVRLGQTFSLEYTSREAVGDEYEEVTNKRSFVVRGITEELSTNIAVNLNRVVSISLPAANAFFKCGGEYDEILIVTEDTTLNDQVEAAIRQQYGEDIGVTSFRALVETIQGFISGFAIFFLGIAGVSMIVAAVGVITTLFTSVMERTREIGTLKALGFRNNSIMSLFLSESLLIGIIGGTIGIILGMVAGSFLLSGLLGGAGINMKPVFLITDLAFVWLFSVAISTLAGFYPAWRASKLDAVVAIRKE
jgi:putative ABC transport system permease protein